MTHHNHTELEQRRKKRGRKLWEKVWLHFQRAFLDYFFPCLRNCTLALSSGTVEPGQLDTKVKLYRAELTLDFKTFDKYNAVLI